MWIEVPIIFFESTVLKQGDSLSPFLLILSRTCDQESPRESGRAGTECPNSGFYLCCSCLWQANGDPHLPSLTGWYVSSGLWSNSWNCWAPGWWRGILIRKEIRSVDSYFWGKLGELLRSFGDWRRRCYGGGVAALASSWMSTPRRL
jgi:hypothetical protein